MKIVGQDYEHSCFLACLESFLADHGTFISQAQIIQDFPQYCMGKDGKMVGAFLHRVDDISNLLEMGKRYWFAAEPCNLGDRNLTPKQTIFIGFTNYKSNGVCHTVRFFGYLKDKTVEKRITIMNPLKIDDYDYISKSELTDWKPTFLLLTAAT